MRPVLITGANGQLGAELVAALAPATQVVAMTRAQLDLGDVDAIAACIREHRPGFILNAGAYTAVDRAETESERAYAVNGQAPGVLAEQAKRVGAVLIHYSTDYVFDGRAAHAL